jgi:hypothetical protein
LRSYARKSDYIRIMRSTANPPTRLLPGAAPFTKAEQAEWDALSDTERLAIFDKMFESPECNTLVDETMTEILAANRARMKNVR